MDPARTPLGRMLLDEITPAVMVLGTPLVEEACRKNGLSFVEMLSPFCGFSNIDGKNLISAVAGSSWACGLAGGLLFLFFLEVLCGLEFDEVLVELGLSLVAVPVRTASDQPYRLQKFKLRLFYASDIRQPDLQVKFQSTHLFVLRLDEKAAGQYAQCDTGWLG